MLPQLEPRAMREHLIVPTIRSRDVACAEWPYVRGFEHFLKLLNLGNDAFNVHASQSSSTRWEWVKRKRFPSPSVAAFHNLPKAGEREVIGEDIRVIGGSTVEQSRPRSHGVFLA